MKVQFGSFTWDGVTTVLHDTGYYRGCTRDALAIRGPLKSVNLNKLAAAVNNVANLRAITVTNEETGDSEVLEGYTLLKSAGQTVVERVTDPHLTEDAAMIEVALYQPTLAEEQNSKILAALAGLGVDVNAL